MLFGVYQCLKNIGVKELIINIRKAHVSFGNGSYSLGMGI
jgi:hypothetical protein